MNWGYVWKVYSTMCSEVLLNYIDKKVLSEKEIVTYSS